MPSSPCQHPQLELRRTSKGASRAQCADCQKGVGGIVPSRCTIPFSAGSLPRWVQPKKRPSQNSKARKMRAYRAGPVWKAKRRSRLAMDGYACTEITSYVPGIRPSLGIPCGLHATHVHHKRYPEAPMVLGEEPLEWLQSLCADHHDAIHGEERV